MKPDNLPRTEIVEQCLTANINVAKDAEGKVITIKAPCAKIVAEEGQQFCIAYRWPFSKWYGDACPLSQRELTAEQERKVNPLKASKRANKK